MHWKWPFKKKAVAIATANKEKAMPKRDEPQLTEELVVACGLFRDAYRKALRKAPAPAEVPTKTIFDLVAAYDRLMNARTDRLMTACANPSVRQASLPIDQNPEPESAPES